MSHTNYRPDLQHYDKRVYDMRCLPSLFLVPGSIISQKFHSWKEGKEIFEDNYFLVIDNSIKIFLKLHLSI